MHQNNSYIDQSQHGIYFFFERICRSHPLIYIFARYLANKLLIFEDDFKGVKKINFKKNINIVDIGASDGIATKFLKKNLNVNKIFAFEPDSTYFKKLEKLKISDLYIFNHGLSSKKQIINIYIPQYKIFNKTFELVTYSYYDKKHLRKVLDQNFFLAKKIKIINKKILLQKTSPFKERIDLIKIDVNGHELQIVKSLKKTIEKFRPVMILEELDKIENIKNFLKNYNYRCYCYDHKKKKLLLYNKLLHNPLNFFFISNKYKIKNI